MALIDDTVLLWTPQAGLKIREDGVLKYVRTGYDMSPEATVPLYPSNDLDGSETASQQPRLVGGIAPNSKVAAAVLNGEIRCFTHPEISFSNTQSWSVTQVIYWEGTPTTTAYFCRLSDSPLSGFILKSGGSNSLRFRDATNLSGNLYATDELIGKQSILTWVYNGTNLQAYLNGVYIGISNNQYTVDFSYLLTNVSTNFSGGVSIFLYKIQSGALTAQQVADEATLLRTMYPEIESVDIGTQTWATRNFEAVATPKGNMIANVTDNADWANATVLYEAAYDAHVGTEEEKEYAGLKAAAMWCYYNNDPDNGAIYGKLYNWYAAKLLDLDMASSGFGWRVPTSAQFTTLATYLGGTSVAGGKMKMTGEDYWNSPNTGATNESGFTALGGAYRNDNGTFNTIKNLCAFAVITGQAQVIDFIDASISGINYQAAPIRGTSVRLIKE